VSYAVVSVPFHRVLYSACFGEPPLGGGLSVGARLRWFVVSSAYLVFAFLIATAIPSFGALQALIGALAGSPIVFCFPPLFFVLASRAADRRLTTTDALYCAVSLLLLFPMFLVLGTTDAVVHVFDSATTAPCVATCAAAATAADSTQVGSILGCSPTHALIGRRLATPA